MEQPNYGVDAWSVVRNLAMIGVGLLALSGLGLVLGRGTVLYELRSAFTPPAISACITATLMFGYAKRGKFRHRDQMLDSIDWRGDETVLDIGTGRGLLLIGAAKRLTTGMSYGVDIWNDADLSGNTIENTLHNTRLEGVADKIEIREDDARALSFPNDTFDVVLSNLCLHNIPQAADRAQACREIARVLKPGGTALISDFKNTGAYKKAFQQAGLQTQLGARNWLHTFPPLRVVRAQK